MNEFIASTKQKIIDRVPLLCVFLSGIGFSIQALTIKILSEEGFHSSFQFIFARGWVQMLLSIVFITIDRRNTNGQPKIFGDNNRVQSILFLRSIAGFIGIAFAFLALELIPMGDSTVLMMLSPLIAAILGFFILGEPWHLAEFCATVVSLVGAVLVIKPPFLFGMNDSNSSGYFFLGVFFALIAAVSAGFAYIFVRILGTTAKMPWANVCFAQALGQLLLSLPTAYLFGQAVQWGIPAFQWLVILSSAALGAFSQILMTVGMQREKSAAATAMRMSDVVFAYIWQSLFTQDDVSFLSVVGAILVSSSILIVVVFKQKAPAKITTQVKLPQSSNPGSLLSIVMNRFTILNDSDSDMEEDIRDDCSDEFEIGTGSDYNSVPVQVSIVDRAISGLEMISSVDAIKKSLNNSKNMLANILGRNNSENQEAQSEDFEKAMDSDNADKENSISNSKKVSYNSKVAYTNISQSMDDGAH